MSQCQSVYLLPSNSPAGAVHRGGRPLAGSTENASIAAGVCALSERMRVCAGTC